MVIHETNMYLYCSNFYLVHKSVVVKGNTGHDSTILGNLDLSTNHQQQFLLALYPLTEKENELISIFESKSNPNAVHHTLFCL